MWKTLLAVTVSWQLALVLLSRKTNKQSILELLALAEADLLRTLREEMKLRKHPRLPEIERRLKELDRHQD
ncbi:MAG: hypothetical protein QXH26_02430 [Candidatus Hadarchaeales archaeon]